MTVRKLCLRLGLVVLSFLVAVAAFEGALRLGIVPNPVHARRQLEKARAPWDTAARKVLVLGDSFMVPENLMSQLVAADLGRENVAVDNRAVVGTGPFEYRGRFLQALQQKLEPDVVLLGYYAGNDLTDVQYNPEFYPGARLTAGRRDAQPRNAAATGPSADPPWYHGLYLHRMVKGDEARSAAPHLRWKRFAKAGITQELIDDAKANRINPYLLQLAVRNPDYLLDNILMETPRNQKAWEKSREILGKIHEACEKRGMKLLVVVFPRSIQIDDSHFQFFQDLTFRTDRRTLTSTRPQDLMAEFCNENGIPCLDLLPVFKARQDEELYFEKDDHLNDVGQRLAAEHIVSFVLENLEPAP